VAEKLKVLEVETEIIKLVEYTLLPGNKTDMGGADQFPEIVGKMDELSDRLLETGHSVFTNKVGGIIITGAEDGAQHLIGDLANFMG
jgi:hypothetical protein